MVGSTSSTSAPSRYARKTSRTHTSSYCARRSAAVEGKLSRCCRTWCVYVLTFANENRRWQHSHCRYPRGSRVGAARNRTPKREGSAVPRLKCALFRGRVEPAGGLEPEIYGLRNRCAAPTRALAAGGCFFRAARPLHHGGVRFETRQRASRAGFAWFTESQLGGGSILYGEALWTVPQPKCHACSFSGNFARSSPRAAAAQLNRITSSPRPANRTIRGGRVRPPPRLHPLVHCEALQLAGSGHGGGHE